MSNITEPRRMVKMFDENKSTDNKLPLPSEKMPHCWKEEERMNALFSPFRSKSANPQDWTSKYKFWHNLIYEWLKHTMRCSFSIVDLNETFKRRGCTPLCLSTVVEELLRNNEIIPEKEFLREPCDTWTSWSIDVFLKRPLTWSLSKVKSYVVTTDIDGETTYVHVQIVKELGDVILCVLEDKRESILVPFPEIVKYCRQNKNVNVTENNVMLALIWLKRARKVAIKNSTNQNEILVKMNTDTTNNITEIDEGLYKLTKQESELVRDIELMEEEKINIINEAKNYLAKGLRQVAKTHLRKKGELERTIEKRAQTLENLRILISSIQDTHSNTAVVSAYKTGSDMLKKFGDSGLTESNVRNILDDLSEAVEDQREVQALLSESFKNNESDIELEQELADLMKQEECEFPAVPSDELNANFVDLEQSFNQLHLSDSPVSAKTSSVLTQKKVNDKKILRKPEYA